jgi:phage terminase small subunit
MANDIVLTLTAKQEEFCRQFTVDFNGTQAAIRSGYSRRTAAVIAHENLRKPQIQSCIAQIVKRRNATTEITAQTVIREIALVAFAKGWVADRDRLRGLEALAKMLGLYRMSRSEMDEILGQTEPIVNDPEVPEGMEVMADLLQQCATLLQPLERESLRIQLEQKLESGEDCDAEELVRTFIAQNPRLQNLSASGRSPIDQGQRESGKQKKSCG